jgi:hypothetical protein
MDKLQKIKPGCEFVPDIIHHPWPLTAPNEQL